MCGIIGIYNFSNSRPVEQAALRKMCSVIKHRGPDSQGTFLENNIGLGIQRLAIIDLQTGNQPIYNEDKTVWVVLNGEIYNFLELRKELEKTHKFYTKSDTEVIVHLYENYGEKCVDYLRGMFSFALWDSKNKKFFAAKDRVGKKPFYYTIVNGSLVFASEIKSILEYLNHTPALDMEALDLFLTYQYIPSPKTIFSNIKSLPPAHTLTCDKNGNIDTRAYWDLDYTKKTNLSFNETCGKIKELLTESTKLRMISDVPLGAFLSGGLDSSIIVGLMSTLSSQKIKTFSIGFDESDFSELKYARIASKHFNTEHREFIVRPKQTDILPKLAWYYGQPYADSSALPSYFVSNETRKHVTVALLGDGGDENFGGYLRYKAMKGSIYMSFPFQILGKTITKKLASLIPYAHTTKGRNIFRYIHRLLIALSEAPERRNINWHCFFTNEQKQELYSDNMKENLYNKGYAYLENMFKNAKAENIMDKTFYTDIKTYLPECLLVKMDIASMANSLEARSPFLDYKMLELSASLPSSWKIHGLTTKYILKKTFKDFIPKEILYRGKMGFGIPIGKWFKTDWKNYFKETVMSEKAVNRGYFKKESLERLFNEHVSGKRNHGYRMWALLMLELWHKVYIDKKI
ncbi:MAG: asparagine synthase (glutamine-hydrolyzing) [Elusimicrobia bacterium]|nr:asparagine synthase (glutamine-hydrolyzing) [Elusimicrobiota bacterium]